MQPLMGKPRAANCGAPKNDLAGALNSNGKSKLGSVTEEME
jgi:hypothetical protein